jgi:hypothetical protein
MWARLGRLSVCALMLFAALSACEPLPPAPPDVKPQARADRPAPPASAAQSAESIALAQYYARVQSDLLARGLLRTDGGGPDTPYTDTMLVRNFDLIALQEEYVRGGGFRTSSGGESRVKKWTQPIRVAAEFGPSIPQAVRNTDRALLARYVDRLARITGHPMTMSDNNPNFHVLFMSEDDRALIQPRIKALVPDINPASLAIFDRLPRAIHCLVIAFSDTPGGYDYGQAIALIRAEHPDLLNRSCIHEEVAQGLGVGNDSPSARPSIFNDDDEFALLTTHDEMLLRILYNPRLRPGMTAEQARPIVADIAAQLTGGPS